MANRDLPNSWPRRRLAFRSLTESLDSIRGRFFTTIRALTTFQRQLQSQRTRAGLQAARSHGNAPGRPAALGPDQIEQLRQLYAAGTHTVAQIAAQFGISRSTLYRVLPSDEASISRAPRRPVRRPSSG